MVKPNQTTIKKEFSLAGIGVHSGNPATITIKPAPPNTGIIFINKHLPKDQIKIGTIIPQQAMHATVLISKSWGISTIEHLMAAISSLAIDNLIIEIDGVAQQSLATPLPIVETPIFDGSALPFVQILTKTGLEKQNKEKAYLTPRRMLSFEQDGRSLEIRPACDANTTLNFKYSVEFEHPLITDTLFTGTITPDFFTQEIAPARTFGFLHQLPFLRKHGLAQGTTLGNTVVVGEDQFLNSLRFENEFIRHKLLDLLGDLALLGKNLVGSVNAHKTGHAFNRLVIKHFVENPELWKEV